MSRHGLSQTPEYQVWRNMLRRCEDPTDPSYDDYGHRGITVCEQWHDVAAFVADMGPRPSDKHSIDRIDNDRGYEPGNCRWATWSEQMRNKRPRTHCKRGHELNEVNARVWRGERYCRVCDRQRAAAKRAERRAA